MAQKTPDGESQVFKNPLTVYIFRNYAQLVSPLENAAYMNLFFTAKSYGDNERLATYKKEGRISDDPAVLGLLSVGVEEFGKRVAERIVRENGEKIILNKCRKCGALARTPQSRQCLACGFDWHNGETKAKR